MVELCLHQHLLPSLHDSTPPLLRTQEQPTFPEVRTGLAFTRRKNLLSDKKDGGISTLLYKRPFVNPIQPQVMHFMRLVSIAKTSRRSVAPFVCFPASLFSKLGLTDGGQFISGQSTNPPLLNMATTRASLLCEISPLLYTPIGEYMFQKYRSLTSVQQFLLSRSLEVFQNGIPEATYRMALYGTQCRHHIPITNSQRHYQKFESGITFLFFFRQGIKHQSNELHLETQEPFIDDHKPAHNPIPTAKIKSLSTN